MNSNVLAPSATMLTKSGIGEDNYDLKALVIRIATGKLKASSHIVGRFNLNSEKLVTSCILQYRAEFPAIYQRGVRVPSHIEEKIRDIVGEWIGEKMAEEFAPEKTYKLERRVVYRQPKLDAGADTGKRYVLDVSMRAEHTIDPKEQLFHCNLDIGNVHRRLTDLSKANRLTPELQDKLDARLKLLEHEKMCIEKEIAATVK